MCMCRVTHKTAIFRFVVLIAQDQDFGNYTEHTVSAQNSRKEFAVTGLEHSTTYLFRIQAFDQTGFGQTRQLRVQTAIAPPSSPVSVTVRFVEGLFFACV